MKDFILPQTRIKELMDDIENGYNKQLKEFYDDLKKIEAQMKNNWTLQQHYAELFLKVQSTPTAFEKFFDTENRDEKKLRSVMQERRDIDEIEQIYAHDSEKRDAAIMYREEQGREERASIEDGWVLDSFGHVSDEFTKGLAKSLTDFGNFKENIKAMADEMAEYLIQRALEAFIKIAMESKYMKAALSTGQSLLKTGTGFLGSVGKAVVNFFNPSKHHSGGVILPGANELIPQQNETLAMLRGGERVLSPSEAASYNDSEGGMPFVFNHYNVKAWDSKDVQKYLLENASLLNSITAQGIRDNRHYLRTMIRNV